MIVRKNARTTPEIRAEIATNTGRPELFVKRPYDHPEGTPGPLTDQCSCLSTDV